MLSTNTNNNAFTSSKQKNTQTNSDNVSGSLKSKDSKVSGPVYTFKDLKNMFIDYRDIFAILNHKNIFTRNNVYVSKIYKNLRTQRQNIFINKYGKETGRDLYKVFIHKSNKDLCLFKQSSFAHLKYKDINTYENIVFIDKLSKPLQINLDNIFIYKI